MFGFTMFNREIVAAEIEKRTGKPTRLARMHWQIENAESYRLRALREFRDAVEIMPEAQNPWLHRRIRGEQVLLGAMGPL
jgi:hypothetical protein